MDHIELKSLKKRLMPKVASLSSYYWPKFSLNTQLKSHLP